MDLDEIIDFANEATEEVGKYFLNISVPPMKLMSDHYQLKSLKWESICYGDEELDKVPNDQRGIYAFSICHENDVLPPHGYILYIGIAGKGSNRSLRTRYKDYLNVKKVKKRARIARMIGHWHQVLRFYFAPIGNEVTSEDLELLEKQLNTAFMPPFSEGDLDAEIKMKRRAFR
ncbi:hypothetical protein [Gimesia fumaroli]|uniref:hypothetical protein n=1 Tax=Gimesia fumaroli TaxID=2527976 RepID=UPI0011AB14B6|nr:hypothetical protein [Gimesia fumaroli]